MPYIDPQIRLDKKQMQQGDVWLEYVGQLPKGCKEIERKGILAYGEVTGHKHQLEDHGIKIYEDSNGMFYVRSEKPTNLNHEEHETITLEPGIVKFGQVREKDWLSGMVKQVAD